MKIYLKLLKLYIVNHRLFFRTDSKEYNVTVLGEGNGSTEYSLVYYFVVTSIR